MGLKSFFKNAMKLRVNVEILSGGQLLTDKDVPIRFVNIAQGENKGEVVVEIPFLSKNKYLLSGIDWEESYSRSAGKTAAGAIVGTVLAPGIGTIAGAAVGAKRKDQSKAYITLTVPDTIDEIVLHVICDQAKYKELSLMR